MSSHVAKAASDAVKASNILARLRGRMESVVEGGLAAYITPSNDAHHASQQLSEEWTLMKQGLPGVPSVAKWLSSTLSPGDKVGLDPKLMSVSEARRLEAAFEDKSVSLVPVDTNLVDELWSEQPARPSEPLQIHPLKFAGVSSADKLASIRANMAEVGATAHVLCALDNIAWALNVRGSDIPHNPVAFAFLLVTLDGCTLFVDASKVSDEVAAHLDGVAIQPYDDVFAGVAEAGATEGAKVWVDPASCNLAIFNSLPADRVLTKPSCVVLEKAKKNAQEIAGMRQANIRDGAALANFFAWLEGAVAAGESLDECSIDDKLTSFRAAQPMFVCPSFETIAGADAHGAIIHYKATPESAAPITADTMLLLDSGGQYLDGTTDTTRTIHLGTPTDRQRRFFTRVLQGHIAVAQAVFPSGTPGRLIDTLARVALWKEGHTFGHGTGHGVGAYLNVHEGPQGLSQRPRPYKGGFVAGMTQSNEPGYYEEGSFGVRIESVHVTQPAGEGREGFLRFENFTPVPIQAKLVDVSLLSDDELQWLNKYHAWCHEVVSPLVGGATLEWLERSTQPLTKAQADGGGAAAAAVAAGATDGAGAGAGVGAGADPRGDAK